MLKAILITLTSWFIGLLFVVTDGQDFTHAVVWIACCLVAATPWWWEMSRRHGHPRRIVAALVVALNLVITLQLATELPEAWRAQHRWNDFSEGATPNRPMKLPIRPQ
jgi:hypothetical protein